MKIIKWFIFLITVSLLILSCKKKDEPCSPYNHIAYVSETLYPFLFDSISQWSYKEINSNKIDNVVVTKFEYSSDIWYAIGPGGNCPDGTLIYFYKIYFSSDEFGESMWYVGFSEISLFLGYADVLYFTNFINGYQYHNATMEGTLDTLTVNGKLYKDVVKMKIEKDWSIEDDMILYWVDSIGIVRKEIKMNNTIVETWDLQSYDVNLYIPSQ